MSLNDLIKKTQEASTPNKNIPAIDRTEQTSYGIGMTERMAERSRIKQEPPVALKPIQPPPN